MKRYWHDQLTSLSLRLYEQDSSYENKDVFVGIIQVELLGDNKAYLHAALKSDGKEITSSEWRGLINLLYEKYQIKTIIIFRKNKEVEIDIENIIFKQKERF